MGRATGRGVESGPPLFLGMPWSPDEPLPVSPFLFGAVEMKINLGVEVAELET